MAEPGSTVWGKQDTSETSQAEFSAASICKASFQCYPSVTLQRFSASSFKYYSTAVTPVLSIPHWHAPGTERAPEKGVMSSLFPPLIPPPQLLQFCVTTATARATHSHSPNTHCVFTEHISHPACTHQKQDLHNDNNCASAISLVSWETGVKEQALVYGLWSTWCSSTAVCLVPERAHVMWGAHHGYQEKALCLCLWWQYHEQKQAKITFNNLASRLKYILMEQYRL